MKTVLIIAGSDSIGGAGLQADIKTATMHGVYAMTAVTALTAQNTKEVTSILDVSSKFLNEQIDAVFTDIKPDAVKIGMVPTEELINIIAKKLQFYAAKNIVVDPVMVSSTGYNLFKENQVESLTKRLFPISALITPNIYETQILSNTQINTEKELLLAAEKISNKYGCNTLCKSGHLKECSNDILYLKNKEHYIIKGTKINNPNTHGTGCTLSSAIASNLALGKNILESVQDAKKYVQNVISANLKLGHGIGPLNHIACKEFLK